MKEMRDMRLSAGRELPLYGMGLAPETDMRGVRRCVSLAIFLVCTEITAGAPLHIRYDAVDTFPEESGFHRSFDSESGPITRTLESGIFTLDTRSSPQLFDLYFVQSSALELTQGEELRVAWRMMTLETDVSLDRSDVGVSITNRQAEFVKFYVGEDFLSEHHLREELGRDSISPDVFHEYVFITRDLNTYEFFIDDEHAFTGQFDGFSLAGSNRITFGDSFSGLTSLSQWDYLEIQVTPEIGSFATLTGLFSLAFRGRRLQ